MTIQQLWYFKRLAEEGALIRTAKKIMITPPSLSASITRLEAELGYQLFIRTNREMTLSENGLIFYRHVCDIFSSLDRAKSEMLANDLTQSSSITTYTVETWILDQVTREYNLAHPDERASCVGFSYKESHDIIDARKDRIDFVVAHPFFLSSQEWYSTYLVSENYPMLLVPRSHPLAAHESVDLEEVKNEPFIIVGKDHAFRAYFDSLFSLAGFTPHIITECAFGARNSMVASGYGISLTTESMRFLSIQRFGDCAFVNIRSPRINYPYCVFWQRNRKLSPEARNYLDFISQRVQCRMRKSSALNLTLSPEKPA